ncbi:MAG TPA: methyltransferase [Longimicrobium sp.]|nr:methyltransferase [Longimicrobium sp.]
MLTFLPWAGDPRPLHPAWEAFCLGVSLTGVLVRALIIGTKPRGTSGRNRRAQVASRLNTTGMYSIVRHPLYVGNALMWAGVALYPRMWTAAALVAAFFWIYYERIMFAEEEFLRRQHGNEWKAWAAATPAFFPDFSLWVRPDLPFAMRAVLAAEYPGFLGLAASFLAIRTVSDLIFLGRVEAHPFWLALFGTAVVGYAVLRTLRKHTRLLQVSGR